MTNPAADSHLTGLRALLPPALTVAFGVCAAMLITAYVLHFPGINLAGGAVGLAMLTVAAVAFVVMLRPAGRQNVVRCGALGGLIAGVVSLVAIGATREEGQSAGAFVATLGVWVAALVGIGALGGAISARSAPSAARPAGGWITVLAIIGWVSVLALMTMGGVVTAAEAGLAVPDWPESFGRNMFLLPRSEMTASSEVYYEHSHRLMGSFVGLLTIGLLALALACGEGKLLKTLAVIALPFVVAQGVAGGLRVDQISTAFAALHGIAAHVFLALIATIALVSTTAWRSAERAGLSARLPLVALVILFLQIALGAVARHFPDSFHGVLTHAGFSLVAAGAVMAAGARASKLENAVLNRFGKACVHTVGLQMALGVGALAVVLLTRDAETPHALDLALTTAHQVVGAALFSMTTLLWVWTARLARA